MPGFNATFPWPAPMVGSLKLWLLVAGLVLHHCDGFKIISYTSILRTQSAQRTIRAGLNGQPGAKEGHAEREQPSIHDLRVDEDATMSSSLTSVNPDDDNGVEGAADGTGTTRRLLQNGFVFGPAPSPSPSPKRPKRPTDTAVLPVFGIDNEGNGPGMLPIPDSLNPPRPDTPPPAVPASPPPPPPSVFAMYPSTNVAPAPVEQPAPGTAPSDAPQTRSAPQTTGASEVAAAPDSSSGPSKPSKQTIIAAVVSSVVAVLALAALVAVLVCKRLKRTAAAAQYPPPPPGWNSYSTCQGDEDEDGHVVLRLVLGKNMSTAEGGKQGDETGPHSEHSDSNGGASGSGSSLSRVEPGAEATATGLGVGAAAGLARHSSPAPPAPLAMLVRLSGAPPSAQLSPERVPHTAAAAAHPQRSRMLLPGVVQMSTRGLMRFTAAHPVSQPTSSPLRVQSHAPMPAGLASSGLPAYKPVSAGHAHRSGRWVSSAASSSPFINPLFRAAEQAALAEQEEAADEVMIAEETYTPPQPPPSRSQFHMPARSIIRIPQALSGAARIGSAMVPPGPLSPAQPLLSGPRSNDITPVVSRRVVSTHVSPYVMSGPRSIQVEAMPLMHTALGPRSHELPVAAAARGAAAGVAAVGAPGGPGVAAAVPVALGVPSASSVLSEPREITSQALSLGSVDDWLPGLAQAIPQTPLRMPPPGAAPGRSPAANRAPPPPRHWR